MMERTYRISDVVNEEFLRFPLTLLASPRYREISLEAKFIYTLLLNRLTLSQRNGWINEDNEVYLIYTREEAAKTLNISYRKAIAAFKELIAVGLLFEQRQGRGYPNLLYVLKTELEDTDAAAFSQSFEQTSPETEAIGLSDSAQLQTCGFDRSRPAETAAQDMRKLQIKTCENGMSRCAGSADPDMSKMQSKKIEKKEIENRERENSQPAIPTQVFEDIQLNRPADKDTLALEKIYARCEFHLFQPHIQTMFRNVIERMYYSDPLKIGNARLPQEKVRSCLQLLDCDILIAALDSMKQNTARILNPTAYLISVLFNGICEKDSSLILHLPPEYQEPEDFFSG